VHGGLGCGTLLGKSALGFNKSHDKRDSNAVLFHFNSVNFSNKNQTFLCN